jgi:hypothetical protein
LTPFGVLVKTVNRRRFGEARSAEVLNMNKGEIKKGMVVWLPCEVRSGPFPNERRIYVKHDNGEWFGFVDVSQLKNKVKQGSDYVRATVIGVQDERVVLGIRGQAPASKPIETRPSFVGGLSPVPA